MQADIVGAVALGGVLGWWWAGVLRARPARPPSVRAWLLLAAAVLAAAADIVVLAGPTAVVAGIGTMAGAVVLHVLFVGALGERDREGGAG